VIGICRSPVRHDREYDGTVYLERVNVYDHASTAAKRAAKYTSPLWGVGHLSHYNGDQTGHQTERHRDSWFESTKIHVGHVARFVASSFHANMIRSALQRRAKVVSLPPSVVVCHDIYALPVGLALKRAFGSRVLYDSHEFWPEGNLLAPTWETLLITAVERKMIRGADAVVTVSTPLARHLQQLYGLARVVVAPNAEPVRKIPPGPPRRTSLPVRFLLQGQIAPGRGIEELVDAWQRVCDERAILYIRAPASRLVEALRRRFRDGLQRGAIVVLPPVDVENLVDGCRFADVGVIPYAGSNLNHRYACPNKLSQYMHAGLAVLTTRLEYVADITNRYGCGVTYEAGDDASLATAIKRLTSDLTALDRMKENALAAARSEFNWEVQSQAYLAELRRLHEARVVANR
jgi:glycosyltransferase involved in cell wall biosynthesis